MSTDKFQDTDSLFNKNKQVIQILEEERHLLESILLDNSVPEEFKNKILEKFITLHELTEKRISIHKELKELKVKSNLIGILYNQNQSEYLDTVIYRLYELSKKQKINIICFNILDIDIKNEYIKGKLISSDGVYESVVSTPKYIINIGIFNKNKNKRKIKEMSNSSNIEVINPVNNFNLSVILDILSSVELLKKSILPIATISPSTLSEHIEKSDLLYLLPERSIPSKCGIRVEKLKKNEDDNFNIQFGYDNFNIQVGDNYLFSEGKNLYNVIKQVIGSIKYIVIQGKKSMLLNGAPLEARVYMQKGILGKWRVTKSISKKDIFCKRSTYKDTVEELEKVLNNCIPDKVNEIMGVIESISINTCTYLDYYFESIGNASIDYIFDEDGNPYIIGFGGWDRNNYLFNLRDKAFAEQYINNSIDYITYLQAKRKEEE